MTSKPADLKTLPVIEKILNLKFIAPLAKLVLEHKLLGPIVKKMLDREIIAYLFFGFLTTIVGFSSFWFCRRFNLSALLSNIVSSVIAIIFAFIVNKHFVFLSKDWSLRNAARELWQFTGGRIVVMAAETGLLFLLVDFIGFNDNICKIITTVLVMITNYIISKLIF